MQRLSRKPESFVFKEDPTITSIRPQHTIFSGGLPLYIEGDRLHLVQNAQIRVTFAGQTFTKVGICVGRVTVAIFDFLIFD